MARGQLDSALLPRRSSSGPKCESAPSRANSIILIYLHDVNRKRLQNDEKIGTEREVRSAVKFLLLRLKMLVETSGAVPAAAVLFRKPPAGIRAIGVVLAGGNVDFEELVKY